VSFVVFSLHFSHIADNRISMRLSWKKGKKTKRSVVFSDLILMKESQHQAPYATSWVEFSALGEIRKFAKKNTKNRSKRHERLD
jgi:hypothetical protein